MDTQQSLPLRMQQEYLKCKENPYYFCTTYIKVRKHDGTEVPFSTRMSEEEFNKEWNERFTMTNNY